MPLPRENRRMMGQAVSLALVPTPVLSIFFICSLSCAFAGATQETCGASSSQPSTPRRSSIRPDGRLRAARWWAF